MGVMEEVGDGSRDWGGGTGDREKRRVTGVLEYPTLT